MENYLQRAWSDATENVGIDEVKKAIAEVQAMGDEHGAFWVAVSGNFEEIILEVDKQIKAILTFDGDQEVTISKQMNSWDEIFQCYDLLLKGEFDELRARIS